MADKKRTLRSILEKLVTNPGVSIMMTAATFDVFVRYAELRKQQEPHTEFTIRKLVNECVYNWCKQSLEAERMKEAQ